MSLSVFPVALRSLLIAGEGPMPIMEGSTPTTENPTILANGLRLCCLTASSLAKTNAPEPSAIP